VSSRARNTTVETIFKLKHPRNPHAMPRIKVTSQGQVVAYLRAIPSDLNGEGLKDALLMTEWRNLHRKAFFSWIAPTEESTAYWLSSAYAPNNQDIMFMIETGDRKPYGHLALYNFNFSEMRCEVGRVVRGTKLGPKGGITLSMLSLLHWAASKLKTRIFFLDVFENNRRAISFYVRCGFQPIERIPLAKIETPKMTRWEKIKVDARKNQKFDQYALRMELNAENLYASLPTNADFG
jgi:RimJ/RimL family protein N-acetyltransferase